MMTKEMAIKGGIILVGTGRATGGKGQSYIPYIPNFLFKTLDKNARANVRKWRDLTNAGKTMVKDDLVSIGNETNGDIKEDESSKGMERRMLFPTV